MSRTPLFTQQAIEKILRKNKGYKQVTANDLKITLRCLDKYFTKFPELKIIREELMETNLDNAELELMKKVDKGELGAICFLLKCKGKHRGYIENPNYQKADPEDKTITYSPTYVSVKNDN